MIEMDICCIVSPGLASYLTLSITFPLFQMSDIYVQEPPCEGKVCLETTVGEIDVELWSRECPKACRNFIQLCLEG